MEPLTLLVVLFPNANYLLLLLHMTHDFINVLGVEAKLLPEPPSKARVRDPRTNVLARLS